MAKVNTKYHAIIEKLFFDRYGGGAVEFEFRRAEIIEAAAALGFAAPKNLGDVVHSFRHRRKLPNSILETQPEGLEWVIKLTGSASYKFRLVKIGVAVPRNGIEAICIPDSTPSIIRANAFNDEQALLAKVRYNRLIDTFLSLTTHSLQSHVRTAVRGFGQIEIHEVYIGIDKEGCQYAIPVRVKSGMDHISYVLAEQDIYFATEKFPEMSCRAVVVQLMSDNQTIAIFELDLQEDEVKIVDERHFRLVIQE